MFVPLFLSFYTLKTQTFEKSKSDIDFTMVLAVRAVFHRPSMFKCLKYKSTILKMLSLLGTFKF